MFLIIKIKFTCWPSCILVEIEYINVRLFTQEIKIAFNMNLYLLKFIIIKWAHIYIHIRIKEKIVNCTYLYMKHIKYNGNKRDRKHNFLL
jgi:hypothetical protein